MKNFLSGLVNGQSSKFTVAVLAAVGEAYQSGHFDLKSLVTGLVAATAVYLIPNAGQLKETVKADGPVVPPAA